jgi:hypothetical protein
MFQVSSDDLWLYSWVQKLQVSSFFYLISFGRKFEFYFYAHINLQNNILTRKPLSTAEWFESRATRWVDEKVAQAIFVVKNITYMYVQHS